MTFVLTVDVLGALGSRQHFSYTYVDMSEFLKGFSDKRCDSIRKQK